MRRLAASIVPLVAIIATTACSDQETPLGPSDHGDTRIATPGEQTPGRSGAFVCVTHVATGGARSTWGGRTVRVRFPASELAPAGQTIAYNYRGYTPDNVIVAAADCRIPATEAAIQRMNRRFHVAASHRIAQRSSSDPRRSYAQGPMFSTELVVIGLETLVATGKWCGPGMIGEHPYCKPISSGTAPSTLEEEPDWGDWSWDDPNHEPDDGTNREPCVYDSPDHCATRPLTQDEWNRLMAAIARIKETSPECAGAKRALQGLAAQGQSAQRFRFWNGYDIRTDAKTGQRVQRYGENRSDAEGRYIEFDSFWVWNSPTLVVHEGLHLFLHQTNAPLLGDDNETWVRTTAETCI